MNDVATIERQDGAMASSTAVEVKAHVQRVQQVMRSVMKDGTHYGLIPGAGDRKSLFKPGAEVLCMTFHIAPDFRVEDLSDADSIRYRVTCIGVHQGSGTVLGQGMGEASSNEEKYKWRAQVCKEEFDETPEDRRRIKWKRGYNNSPAMKIQQVRTEPADIANTVLKMACKRAQVAMTINTTAASDIFTQDLEDMPAEIRETVVQAEAPRGKPATDTPQPAASAASAAAPVATAKQVGLIRARLDSSGVPEDAFLKHFDLAAIEALPFADVDVALKWIKASSP